MWLFFPAAFYHVSLTLMMCANLVLECCAGVRFLILPFTPTGQALPFENKHRFLDMVLILIVIVPYRHFSFGSWCHWTFYLSVACSHYCPFPMWDDALAGKQHWHSTQLVLLTCTGASKIYQRCELGQEEFCFQRARQMYLVGLSRWGSQGRDTGQLVLNHASRTE